MRRRDRQGQLQGLDEVLSGAELAQVCAEARANGRYVQAWEVVGKAGYRVKRVLELAVGPTWRSATMVGRPKMAKDQVQGELF